MMPADLMEDFTFDDGKAVFHPSALAKAMEMGAVEGAMSSLSIVVSGILTVAGASIFALFL